MSSHEVIDLLSTDDEALARNLGPGESSDTTRAQAKFIDTEFPSWSDDHDNDVNLGAWEDKSAKRQRLTPPPAIRQQYPSSGDASPPEVPFRVRTAVHRKNQWVDFSDPIILTSSPPGNKIAGSSTKPIQPISKPNHESDDEFPNDPRHVAINKPASVSPVSDRTAALLASLKGPAQKKAANGGKKAGDKVDSRTKLLLSESEDDRVEAETVRSNRDKTANSKPSKRPKLTEVEKGAKVREKEDKELEKLRKAKEKEYEKEKKRLGKEEKAWEKQVAADLAEANRSKFDKTTTTSEMIVDLPASIDGQSVATQIREILKNLGVDTNVYQSQVPNVVKWRRKANRIYNKEKGYWDPLQRTEIQEEKHVMCLMSAKEFVALATADVSDANGQDLETHARELESKHKDCTPIYLIEGLNAWMRKNKTIRNRAYQAAVLNQDNQGNSSATNEKQNAKRKKPADQYIDEDMIEDALLRLQVIYNYLIHHTAASVETAEWVANFTQHISTIPYK